MTIRWLRAVFTLTALTSILCMSMSCTALTEVPHPSSPRPFTEADRPVIQGTNAMGLDLLRSVFDLKSGNVFMSPVSLAQALTVAYNGADGTTASAMAEALGIAKLSRDQANSSNAAITASMTKLDPKVEISVANALWVNKRYRVKGSFVDTNRRYFDTEVATLKFGPAAVESINGWVSTATKGKIPEIIGELSPEDPLIITNAVYFKGTWSQPFDRNYTYKGIFHLPKGESKEISMMRQVAHFGYAETSELQAIRLPYGNGGIAMYVLLPKPVIDVFSYTRDTDLARWNAVLANVRNHDTEVRLCLPRFRLEYNTELKRPLSALGMGVAFDPERANFSGMIEASENVHIGHVRHGTVLEVDEEGTVAAAATAIEMGDTGMPPPLPEMIVDRPFVVGIVDEKTDAIIFLGVVVDPQSM